MILNYLKKGYDTMTSSCSYIYNKTSDKISDIIYGNCNGIKSLYLFISIIFQVKHIVNNDLLYDKISIQNLKSSIFNCGCISIKFTQWIISKLKGTDNKNKFNYIIGEFENIFDNCEYHDIKHTKKIFKHEFNKNIEEIFDINNFEVIASGSIGQVYKTKFKKVKNPLENPDIVIKVRHPYIDYIKSYQMIIIYIILGMQKITYFKNKFCIHFNLHDFVDNINKQIDFNIEAYNNIKFYNNYKNNEFVVIPKVYNFSKNIIISSFEDGSYIDDISEYQKCKVALNLMSLAYNMCIVDNFMHGDLHIKNWKVRPYKKSYQIILYDFGICFEGPSKEFNMKILEYAETQKIKKLISLFLEDYNYNMEKDEFVKLLYGRFKEICEEPFNMNIVFNKLIYLFSEYNLIINNLFLNIMLFFCLLENILKKTNIICQDPSIIGIDNIVKNQKLDIITYCKTYNVYPELQNITENQLNRYNKNTNTKDIMFIRTKLSNFVFDNPDDIQEDNNDEENDDN
jgi:predicted unusual protein kinase regulating ubiquinone biosynthesis (AarF/ABC1/UbiB family)